MTRFLLSSAYGLLSPVDAGLIQSFFTIAGYDGDQVHTILGVRPPAEMEVRGSDSQDRMDLDGFYHDRVSKRLSQKDRTNVEIRTTAACPARKLPPTSSELGSLPPILAVTESSH